MSEDDTPVTVRLADTVYESVRGINHATISREAIPAPEVYRVLGSLKLLGAGLDQALSQLGAGLGRSLDMYDVYEDNGADPLVSVVMAVDLLTEARTHATELGQLLAQAQVAINGQGYRDAQHDEQEAEAAAELEDDEDDPLACMRCRVGAPLPHRRHDPACIEHQGA